MQSSRFAILQDFNVCGHTSLQLLYMACRSFLAPAHFSLGPAGNGIAFAGICLQMPPRTRYFAGAQFRAWQQRQAAVDAPDAAAPPPPAPLAVAPLPGATVRPSAQFQAMMEMVMVGHMSCATANRIAVGQAADGHPMHPEMKMLAELGTAGRWRGNVSRDLENKLRLQECNFPEPLYIPLPVLDRKPAFGWADFTQGSCGPIDACKGVACKGMACKGMACKGRRNIKGMLYTFDVAFQTYKARQSTSAQSRLD